MCACATEIGFPYSWVSLDVSLLFWSPLITVWVGFLGFSFVLGVGAVGREWEASGNTHRPAWSCRGGRPMHCSLLALIASACSHPQSTAKSRMFGQGKGEHGCDCERAGGAAGRSVARRQHNLWCWCLSSVHQGLNIQQLLPGRGRGKKGRVL